MKHYTLSTLQKLAVAKLWNRFNSGEKSVLGVMCTGGGKTVVGMAFICEWLEANPGCNVQIIVPAVSLVGQFHETAQGFGIDVSVYHGELNYRINNFGKKVPMRYNPAARVNISLPDTFSALVSGDNKYGFDFNWKPGLILFDEAHKNTSLNSYVIRGFWKDALVLGLTATPRRETNNEDCEYLWNWYDEPEVLVSPRELILEGRIVEPNFITVSDDRSMFQVWKELAENEINRSTIIVTSGGDNSLYAIYEVFRRQGVSVNYLSSVELKDTNGRVVLPAQSAKLRQQIQADFRNGKFEVLVSVDTICEGFDAPRAKYVLVDRNITAESLWHQVCGRVLRAFTYENGEVKTSGTIVDFSDCFAKYKSVIDRKWSKSDYAPGLEVKVPTNSSVRMGDLKGRNKRMFVACECTEIFDVISCGSFCPYCKTPSNITISVDVRDFIRKCYNIESKDFAQSRDWAKTIFESKIDYTAKNNTGYSFHPKVRNDRNLLNNALGFVLINPETGKPKKSNRVLNQIMFSTKPDGSQYFLDDRIEIKLEDLSTDLYEKLRE